MTSSKYHALIKNHARHVYEVQFDSMRREAKKRNVDLSLLLSTEFMMSGEGHFKGISVITFMLTFRNIIIA